MKNKRNEIIGCLAVISILVVVVFILYYYTESDDVKIKNYLIEQGYESAEHIELTKVKGRGNLYQASEAIDIGDGDMIEYWEISYFGVSSLLYIIKPYSSPSYSVKLSFSTTD